MASRQSGQYGYVYCPGILENVYDYDFIENVENGTLTYTDELIAKAEKAFGVKLVKNVPFDEIENVAEFIINEIINKNIG